MIVGLNLKETVDYQLKADTDNPTIWKIGVIPSDLFSKICSDAEKDKMAAVYKIAQLTIKGWENFSVPFSTAKEKFYGEELDVVPMSVLRQIPLGVISEISKQAMEMNQVSEPERKN